MGEQRIANKRLDTDGGAWIDRRLAFNKENLPVLDQGWNDYALTIDEFGVTSLTPLSNQFFCIQYEYTSSIDTLLNPSSSHFSLNSLTSSLIILLVFSML
jgi:hypothetical protein